MLPVPKRRVSVDPDLGLKKVQGTFRYGGQWYEGRAASFKPAAGVAVLVICDNDAELAIVGEGMGIRFDPSKAHDVIVAQAAKVEKE